MLKNQRHNEIIEILKKEGFAEVRSLGDRLYASQPTIRRDLDLLEKQGYIRRSHGGAMLADDKINTPVSFRRGTKAREKAQICRLAASLIKSGSLIFADASTTASHLADVLNERDNVTVVTNGYPICRALSENNVQVFSTGGRLLKNSMAFVGSQAEEAVRRYNADWLFFSSSSLDNDGMISDYSEEETALRIAMRTGAQRSVFLCDSTKIGKASAFRAFSLSEVDCIVTDTPLPESMLNTHGFVLQKNEGGAFLYGKEK